MDDDLNLHLLFIADQHPGMRVDLQNLPNTGGWRLDCAMVFVNGETPMICAEKLMKELRHKPEHYRLWLQKKILDD
jgi:hypothetical protein